MRSRTQNFHNPHKVHLSPSESSVHSSRGCACVQPWCGRVRGVTAKHGKITNARGTSWRESPLAYLCIDQAVGHSWVTVTSPGKRRHGAGGSLRTPAVLPPWKLRRYPLLCPSWSSCVGQVEIIQELQGVFPASPVCFTTTRPGPTHSPCLPQSQFPSRQAAGTRWSPLSFLTCPLAH